MIRLVFRVKFRRWALRQEPAYRYKSFTFPESGYRLRSRMLCDRIQEIIPGETMMSNSDFTKFMIARGLKQLLEMKSFTDVTVGDIARHCKMSRNTFYYHFKDKCDVINWIFYTEITPLIGDTVSIDKWGSGMRALCHYMQENKAFYTNVVQFEGQNSLSDCLMEFYENLVQNIILNARGEKVLRPQQIKIISRFYAHGMSGVLLDWIKNGMIKEPDATVTMLEELLSGEIFHQIISQQDDAAFSEERGLR